MQRGLAKASIRALMWEGRNFLSWYTAHNSVDDFSQLNIKDIDTYFAMRAAAGLRRRSLKDVAERLRSLMRFLHRTDRIGIDLAPRIIAPVLYAYESIPSALSAEQISAVLKNTRKDRSPLGYRDYAMLLLLSTYGLRDGEITRLRLEDIDWRAETLHIRHSKTGASSTVTVDGRGWRGAAQLSASRPTEDRRSRNLHPHAGPLSPALFPL